MRNRALAAMILVWTIIFAPLSGAGQQKVIYVDSLQPGCQWGAQISRGISSVLQNRSDVDLKILRMDIKENASDAQKQAASLEARNTIEAFGPDVVIASGDTAAKYLILPYYKSGPLPVVVCGILWDVSGFGFPAKNVAGVVQKISFGSAIKTLKQFSKGDRIGFISADTGGAHKTLQCLSTLFDVQFNARFVTSFDEFKHAFLNLEEACDMLLIGQCLSLKGYSPGQMTDFIRIKTCIPTLSLDSRLAEYALLTYAPTGTFQGKKAARTALGILSGRPLETFGLMVNQDTQVYLNMALAKKLNIKFPIDLMEYARLTGIEKKKLFFINSYHQGFSWSDDIETGLAKALDIRINPDRSLDMSQARVDLKIFRMDTKRNPSESFIKGAALKAKEMIDAWQPDILVAGDDGAVKYVIAPYYVNSDLNVVFCGLNGKVSEYGISAPNITGMVESAPYDQTLILLQKFAKGNRVAVIGSDAYCNRKEFAKPERKQILQDGEMRLVNNYESWKTAYLELQDKADMLVLLDLEGIKNWNSQTVRQFILENTKIVTGAFFDCEIQYALMGWTAIAEEHGWWSGKTALKILNGACPADIPITINRHSKLYLNLELADRLGIKFPVDLMEQANFIPPLRKKRP